MGDGAVVESGTTVQIPPFALPEITTTGLFLTISGGMNPVEKLQ